MVEAPGSSPPFSLEPIMVKLEGVGYIGPIIPVSLDNLVAGRRPAGRGAPKSRSDSGSGSGSRTN